MATWTSALTWASNSWSNTAVHSVPCSSKELMVARNIAEHHALSTDCHLGIQLKDPTVSVAIHLAWR